MATLLVERPTTAMPAPPTLRAFDPPLPLPSTMSMSMTNLFSFGGPLQSKMPFTFTFPTPTSKDRPLFTFSLITKRAADPRFNPLKRRRRLTDVDGDGTAPLLRKKRRLLKTLITSRLSRPFSWPATHIGDRGSNKAVHWARIRRTRSGMVAANFKIGSHSLEMQQQQQQQLGCGHEQPLRKAAILNRLRLLNVRSRNSTEFDLAAAAAEPVKDQLRRSQEPGIGGGGDAMRSTDEPFVEATECRVQSPNMAAPLLPYAPLEPSPLALSNYDALDFEDEWPDDDDEVYDEYGDGGDGEGGHRRRESIYSDFSVFDSTSAEDDDDDDRNTLGFSAMPH